LRKSVTPSDGSTDCAEAETLLSSVTTSQRKQEASWDVISCHIDLRTAARLCYNFEICCLCFFQFSENFFFSRQLALSLLDYLIQGFNRGPRSSLVFQTEDMQFYH